MSNTLVDPDDMAHLAGAPFTEEEIDTAAAVLRAACGWHIAPVISQRTVTVDVLSNTYTVRLPTRQLVSVDEIRDTDTDTVIDDATYRVSLGRGSVSRIGSYWPTGLGRLEVDITDGYTTVPPDLLPVLAEIARQYTADTAGEFRIGYGDFGATLVDNPIGTRQTMERYMLLTLPGLA